MGSRARGSRGNNRVAEDEEPSQSQSSQSTRTAGVMDPSQDLSDRRKIRRSYRELIQQTNGIQTLPPFGEHIIIRNRPKARVYSSRIRWAVQGYCSW